MEYREAELREVVTSDAPDDNPARFLRELRQLRNAAGLEHVELAARAHYPCDAILAAEAGPALPDLPVLSAYVRGCGGTVPEWEERWRTVTRSPALTLLPTRSAGCSDAAVAGARIGSVSLAADTHDPAIIMAALGRVANGITSEAPAVRSASVRSAAARSLFTPASAVAPLPESLPDPMPDPASEFTVDSMPAANAAPAATPEAEAAPEPDAGSAPWEVSRPSTPSAAAVPDVAVAEPGGGPAVPAVPPAPSAPPVVKPVSVAGRAPYDRRPMPSKPVLAVIAILVCLAATIWALLS